MPVVSAVLFDFGQVLSQPADPAVWQLMQGLTGISDDALHRAYWRHRDEYDRGTLTGEAFWQQVAREGDRAFDPETLAALLSLDVELWTRMNAPVVRWVKGLHAAGIRTGILSNMGDRMASGIEAKFDWIGRFHHAVWSHALLLRKPEPAIYAAAVQGLGVPAGEILFLDDKPENVEAAIAGGMQAIVFTDYATLLRELETRGLNELLQLAHEAA